MEASRDPHTETLATRLATLAERLATHPALLAPDRTPFTFGDLYEQANEVKAALARWGIRPGDIVAGFIEARPAMAAAAATLPTGCSFAPLAASMSEASLRETIGRLRPKAVVVSGASSAALAALARSLNITVLEADVDPESAGRFGLRLAHESPSLGAMAPSCAESIADIVVSSGTTGRQKLIPTEQSHLVRYSDVGAHWLQFSPADVGCHAGQIHLASGLHNSLLNPLLAGMPMVVLPESDVGAIFEAIATFDLSVINAGFTMFRQILQQAPDHASLLRSTRVRLLRSGLGRLDVAEIDRLEQAFSAPLLVGYSSSETHAITHDPLPPRRRKPGAVGTAIDHPYANKVCVLAEDGTIAATGSGELVVGGPLVFSGYLDDPVLNAHSLRDGWFRTGDFGSIDDEGYVHLLGRVSEIINRGGEKISPTEIDFALQSHASIKEAAAFGVPHPTLGHEVVAAVVPAAGARLDIPVILDNMRSRLGLRRAPRRLYVVGALPRTSNGKIRRSTLIELTGATAHAAQQDDQDGARAVDAFVSPAESALLGLWLSVLEVDRVERNDDFFLAGGDSLRGSRLIAHVRTVFEVELTHEDLFGRASSIASMAELISARRSGIDSQAVA